MSTADMQEPEDFGREVDFEIIENRGAQATLECPACGFVFDVDARGELNLEWSKKQRALVAMCPICKRKQR